MSRFLFFPDDGSYAYGGGMYAQFKRAPIPHMCRKYHISTAITTAFTVADTCLPILADVGILHKIVVDLDQLKRQMQGNQVGKFITIYAPASDPVKSPLIERLASALDASGATPSPFLPKSRQHKHVFAEQPIDERMFIYGGFVVDPRV